jgi:hypothetical protein
MPGILPSLEETCSLKGKLTVNRVAGVFAVRFTRTLYNATKLHKFNLSHVLGRIRFGPKVPWTSTPLQAIRVTQKSEQPLHYYYELICTPVIFVEDGKIVERTYEYIPIATASQPNPAARKSPGLFFWYQFTPYTVTVVHRTKPLSTFVAATFGVLSGGFALTSLFDYFLYRSSKQKVLD